MLRPVITKLGVAMFQVFSIEKQLLGLSASGAPREDLVKRVCRVGTVTVLAAASPKQSGHHPPCTLVRPENKHCSPGQKSLAVDM